jgi:hypothetical protein
VIKIMNLRLERLERRLRRLHKPDGNCLHCEHPADRYHPVGPIVVRVSEPDDNETWWTYEFCNWECFAHWAAVEAGFVTPHYGALDS